MTARPILSREVLARMTNHVVTVYLTDGNHITGRLSSIIVSGHRHDPGETAQGLHLVDLADGTPHDVAYVYLPHVVAIAPARNHDHTARGDEPTARPSSQTRHVELLDQDNGSARFVLDRDVQIDLEQDARNTVRRFKASWVSEGTPVSIELLPSTAGAELVVTIEGHPEASS